MSRFKLPDGRVVQGYDYFTLDVNGDIEHFNGGVAAIPAERRTALDITEIIEQPRPDERFYFVTEDPGNPGSYLAVPRDIAAVKTSMEAQARDIARSILNQTDWQAIRSLDGKPVDDAVKASRQATRNHCDSLVASIEAAATFDDLAGINMASGWPEVPK